MTNGADLGGLVPRPDPTVLTTEQLVREIANLRAIIETRLDANDKATDLIQQEISRRLDTLARFRESEVDALRLLHEEKLRSVGQRLGDFADEVSVRFAERDTRSEREARDNKIAVDAAFAAAKEAVAENNKASETATGKSEAGFTKQIDQLTLLIETRAKASDDKIDDIKSQLANSQGRGQGIAEFKTQQLAVAAIIITVIVSVIYYIATHH